MKNGMEISTESCITLNNADNVIENLKSKTKDCEDDFLTMVQGNSFGGVDISESNIENNAKFIVELWD